MSNVATKRRVAIDTDPGVDDAIALLLALGSPAIQIELITTVYGNADLGTTTANAHQILRIVEKDMIPVRAGRTLPLLRDPVFAPKFHGEDGLGGAADRAVGGFKTGGVQALIDLVNSSPNEVTVVALGPLTNIAMAILMDPTFASNVHEIILMGGAALTWGNASPAASANMRNDPEAADIVYRSGANIVQVGLDVCRPASLPSSLMRVFQNSSSHVGQFIWKLAEFRGATVDPSPSVKDETFVHFNDGPAIGYLLDESMFEVQNLPTRIETRGELTLGATVVDFDGVWDQVPNARVCLSIDVDAYRTFFRDILSSYL